MAIVNILILASHAVAEFDDLRMFHDLGYQVFVPGGYEDPRTGTEGIRPPLPEVPFHRELAQRCQEQRAALGEPGEHIDWAKAQLHDDVIDWADVIIVHHFPQVWIGGQWDRIKHKRVIWRTCGQSDPNTESFMSQFDGLEIVRYSPREREVFEKLGCFAGETTLIRFGKYSDDYGPYVGDWEVVGNLTQDMIARGDATGLSMWRRLTEGLPVKPAGKGSEALGGVGALSYEDMLDYLRHLRTYLFVGTKPASYTLGLIEAMLSGVPVVAVGHEVHSTAELWVSNLSEAQDIVPHNGMAYRSSLETYLKHPEHAAFRGEEVRQRAIDLFDVATVGPQWRAFLS